MPDHDALIDILSASAGPVRRVSPAWLRAALLAPVMLVLGFASTTLLHQATGVWSMPPLGTGVANAVLSLALGVASLIGALSLSIAGGGVPGKGTMMAGVAAWLAVAAADIGVSPPASAGGAGHPFCFAFLVVAGLPMAAAVILALRRTRSLRPVPTLILAGGSVAFMSFGLLAFCHPVELAIADFVTHLMAAIVLGLLTVAVGHRAVAV